MPTLQELTDLFDELPELPPPLPRQRRPPVPTSNTTPTPVSSDGPQAPASPQLVQAPIVFRSPPTRQLSLISRLFPWAFRQPPAQDNGPVRKPHPFMALKAGKKIVVIAVVDSGSISFFRFGQGAFTEWPMI